MSGNRITRYQKGGIIVVGGPGYGTCPDGSPCAYTTGIQIVPNTIADNDVDTVAIDADVSFTNRPKVHANK